MFVLLASLYNGTECVDITSKFNSNSIYDVLNPDGANFDGANNAFPSDYLPCGSYIKDPRYDVWFEIPSANGDDSWRIGTAGATVDITNGNYLTLHVLATSCGSQSFSLTVHYTDATTQELSFHTEDWAPEYDPKTQPGGDAFLVVPFRYANTAGTPSKDWKPVRIYSLMGVLDSTKTVDYIEVSGANSNVVIFSISLRPAVSTGNFVKVDLSPYYNLDGVASSASGTGNFDGGGYAFPDDTSDVFPFGDVVYIGAYYAEFLVNATESSNNFIAPSGQNIDVPDGNYKHIFVAVAGAVGDHSLKITLHRVDGSSQEIDFVVPDWCVGSGLVLKKFSKRFNTSTGDTDTNNNPKIFVVDAPIDSSIAVTSLTLGGEAYARVLAISFSDSDPVWLSKYGFLAGLTSKDSRVDRLINLFKYSILAFTIPCDSTHFRDFRDAWVKVFEDIDIDEYYSNPDLFFSKVEQAYSNLESALVNYGGGTSGIMDRCVYYFPQSHLDYIWLWRWPSTIEKARYTFERNLEYMDSDSHYIFVQSTPAYFEWMKEYYPDLFERIKNYVLSGRFKLVGGYLNEPDQNLPSGEGLVRSRLYGYELYKELFGEQVARDAIQIEWLPDTFGFSASIPQIMAKSGVKLFVTTKLTWVGDYGFYPHFWNFNIVRWKSLDGSEILAYQTTYGLSFEKDIYVSQLLEMGKPGNFEERNRFTVDANKEFKLSDYNSYQDKNNASIYQSNGINIRGILIGLGDGGSGVTPEGYWRYTVYSLAGGDLIKGGSPQQFYQELLQRVGTQYSHIPVWNDELYLMYHRACYTHSSVIKYWLRKCESSLEWSEKASALASVLGYGYDPHDFYELWKKFAVNYFHDIAPGSAIAEAYVDQVKFMQDVDREAEEKGKEALEFIAAKAKTDIKEDADGSILVFNPLSWTRTDPVWVEWDEDNYARVYNEQGDEIPVQYVEESGKRYLVFVARDVPSMGYKVYTYKKYLGDYPPSGYDNSTSGYDAELSVSDSTMGNHYYDLTLNTLTGSGVGAIIKQIHDKELGKDLIETGDNVSLAVFGGYPDEYPAWNYRNQTDEPSYALNNWSSFLTLESVSTTREGPVFVEKKFTFSYRRTNDFGDSYKWPVDPQASTIEVYVRLYANLKKVYLKFKWNWYGYNALVKVRYPLSVAASFAHTEIPYGEYDRPLVPTNDAEYHRWEFPVQRWVDLDDGTWGVTVSNFAKYGWDVLECSNGVNSPTGKHVLRASLIWFPDDHGNHDDNYYHDSDHWWEEENQEAVFTISSHSSNWIVAKAWKRGYELNVPLVAVFSDVHEGELPPVYSFMSYSGNEDIAVTAFKKSDDGSAYIVRLFNFASDSNKTVDSLHLPFQIDGAYETNLLEEDEVASVEFENYQGVGYLKNIIFAPTEIKTFRVVPKVTIEVGKPGVREVVDGTLRIEGRVLAPGQSNLRIVCSLIKDESVFTVGESTSSEFNFTYDVSGLSNGWATLRISAGTCSEDVPVYIGNGYGSAFEYVDPGWNIDAWGYTEVEFDGNADGVGCALPADSVPVSGSLWMPSASGVCYKVWDVHGNAYNALKVSSDTDVDLPDGNYYRAGFLFISVNGASSAQMRLNYSDGSYKDLTLDLPDWCDSSFVASAPVTFPYRDVGKGLEKITCGIKEYVVDLDPSKTLTGLEFNSVNVPASGWFIVVGISLEKVPKLLQAYPSGSGATPGVLPWAEFSAPVFVGGFEVIPAQTSSWTLSPSYGNDFCRVESLSDRVTEPSENYKVVLSSCKSATGRNIGPFSWTFSTSSSPIFAFLETPQNGGYYRGLEVKGAILGTTFKSYALRVDGKTVLSSTEPTRYATIYSQPSIQEGTHTLELSVIGETVIKITRTFTVDRTPASLKKVLCGNQDVGNGDRITSRRVTFVFYDRTSGVKVGSIRVEVNGKSVEGSASVNQETVFYTCDLGTSGRAEVRVFVEDVAGNEANYNLELLVDTSPTHEIVNALPFPNPAKDKVCITYVLGDEASRVDIKIFDVSGRKVAVLKGGTSVGYNQAWWDLTNAFGRDVANGIYIVKIEAVFGNERKVAKTKVLVMK